MSLKNIIEKDIQVFGEDVVSDVYKDVAKLYLLEYNIDLLKEYGDDWGEPGLLQKFFMKIFGRNKNLTNQVNNVVSSGAAAAAAEGTVAKTGILNKIFSTLKGGISNIFSPENLPKVLASAGGAALIALLIRALKRRKRRNITVEEAYKQIENSKIDLLMEEIFPIKTFKYFNY
ncbi:MAG: hypothetical protein LBF97_02270 [Elusimicrobiota bacterium]|jgi:hypothetical protein|nr:hypothetical protein [Elusimicrobiota bacterium]